MASQDAATVRDCIRRLQDEIDLNDLDPAEKASKRARIVDLSAIVVSATNDPADRAPAETQLSQVDERLYLTHLARLQKDDISDAQRAMSLRIIDRYRANQAVQLASAAAEYQRQAEERRRRAAELRAASEAERRLYKARNLRSQEYGGVAFETWSTYKSHGEDFRAAEARGCVQPANWQELLSPPTDGTVERIAETFVESYAKEFAIDLSTSSSNVADNLPDSVSTNSESKLENWCRHTLCRHDWGARTLHDTSAASTYEAWPSGPCLTVTNGPGLPSTVDVVAIVVLQASSEPLDAMSEGQAISIAEQTLLTSPYLRSRIYVVATDGRQSVLFRCKLMTFEDNIRIDAYARVASSRESLRLITALMLAHDSVLDAPMRRVGRRPIRRLLGRGGASVVVEVVDDPERSMFAKIFESYDIGKREYAILKRVESSGASPFTNLEFLELTSSSGEALYAIVASPVLKPISLHDMRLKDWSRLLDLISTLHRCRYVHRDIKPSNFLLRNANQELCLIDFGYAVRIGSVEPFGGTTTFASARVLGYLAQGDYCLALTPSDDLESFVKSLWSWCRKEAWERAQEHVGPRPWGRLEDMADWAIKLWNRFLDDDLNRVLADKIQKSLEFARTRRVRDLRAEVGLDHI